MIRKKFKTLNFIRPTTLNIKTMSTMAGRSISEAFYEKFLQRASKSLKSRFSSDSDKQYFVNTNLVHRSNQQNKESDNSPVDIIVNLLLQMRASQSKQTGLINSLMVKQGLMDTLERELLFAKDALSNAQIKQIHNTVINNNFDSEEFKRLITSLTENKKKNIYENLNKEITSLNDKRDTNNIKLSNLEFINNVSNKYNLSTNNLRDVIHNTNLINRENKTTVKNETENVLRENRVQREINKERVQSEKTIENLINQQRLINKLELKENNTNRVNLSKEVLNKYREIENKAVKKYISESTFLSTNLINRENKTTVKNETENVLRENRVQREINKERVQSEKTIENLINQQKLINKLELKENNTNRINLSKEVLNKYREIENKAVKKYISESTFLSTNLINRENKTTVKNETENVLRENRVQREINKERVQSEKTIENLINQQKLINKLELKENNTNRINLSKEVLNKYREIENKAVKKYISENTFLSTNLINRENKTTVKNETENVLRENRVQKEINKERVQSEKTIENLINQQKLINKPELKENNTNRINLSKEVLNKYREIENKAVKKYISENTFLSTNLINRENKTTVKNETENVLRENRVQREINKERVQSEKTIENLINQQKLIDKFELRENNTNRINLSKEVLNKYREIENKAVKKYISENTFLSTNLINRENKTTVKNETENEKRILSGKIEREQNTHVEKIVGNRIDHINKEVEEIVQRNMSLVSKSISNVFNKSVNNENWLTQKLNEEFTFYKSTNLINSINKFNPESVQREVTKRITNISKKYSERTILKGNKANPLILNSRNNSREYYNEIVENIGKDFVVLQKPGEPVERFTSSAHMEYKKPISLKGLTERISPEVEEGLKVLKSQQNGTLQNAEIKEHYGRSNTATSGLSRFETKQLVRECIDDMADEITVDVDEISREIMDKIERMLELERKRYGIKR